MHTDQRSFATKCHPIKKEVNVYGWDHAPVAAVIDIEF
jgi:hypothetical protein